MPFFKPADWLIGLETGLIKDNPGENRFKMPLLKDNTSQSSSYTLPAKGSALNYDNVKNMFIVSDRNMINTILRNLLGNAVKYTGRGGKVFVTTTIESNEIHISVKDTGTGISEEEIEKLFRLDSKFSKPGTANETGTGLGLKLCREFAEKMGGRIRVESFENKGSEFKLSIPVQ